MNKSLFLFALIFTAFTCNKTVDSSIDNPAVFVYAETQCADPWLEITDASTKEDAIRIYLEDKYGIVFTNFEQIPPPADEFYCAACTCTNGRQIKITADVSHEATLKGLGFVKQ